MTTHVTIPDEAHKGFKRYCEDNGYIMKKKVPEALELWRRVDNGDLQTTETSND